MPAKKIVETIKENCGSCRCQPVHHGGGSGAIYGLGIFGAAFYFFPQAVGLSGFAMAIFKSLIWPGILVYQALTLLNL